MRCSSTKPGRSRSRTSSLWRDPPRVSYCSATRSNSRSPCTGATHQVQSARPSPTSSERPRRCHPSVACSSRRRGACIRTCASSRPKCSMTTASSRRGTWVSNASTPEPWRSCMALGPACWRCPAKGPTTSPRPRPIASPSSSGRSSRAGPPGSTRTVRLARSAGATILVVAPYNAQVGAIRSRLPAEARVGTVDKFQGQEAPISIYSMTTSSPELAPRGMDFLYSRNRLNVATSRARCVSVVAMSPDLLRVRARTPEQMRLANAICRYAELATNLA